MVVANLRADQQGIEWLRQTRRLEVDAERDLFIRRLGDCDEIVGRYAAQRVSEIEIARERRRVEARVVAPYLRPPLQGEHVAEAVAAVPAHAAGLRLVQARRRPLHLAPTSF